jgi:hypothetical protein
MKKLLVILALAAMPLLAVQAQVVTNPQLPAQAAGTAAKALIQKAGDTRSAIKFQADCAAGIAVDSCVAAPTPKGCPTGTHWSLEGSGIAHCVLDALTCESGTVLVHDTFGNPSCTVVTAPVAPVVIEPTPTPTPEPAPTTCVPQKFIVSTIPCANGVAGNAIGYYMACTKRTERFPMADYVDNSACVAPPVCAGSDSVQAIPCSGSSEVTYQHTVVTCPGAVVSSYSTGTCPVATPVCKNGASDYPACAKLGEIDLSGIPARAYATKDSYADDTAQMVALVFSRDGRWRVIETRNDAAGFRQQETNGQLLAVGADRKDYQVLIHVLSESSSVPGVRGRPFDTPYRDKWWNIGAATGPTASNALIADGASFPEGSPEGAKNGQQNWSVVYEYTVQKISDPTVQVTKQIQLVIGPRAATFNTAVPGDVDGDGDVDCDDVAIVKGAMGMSVSQYGYDLRTDVVYDKTTNVRDLAFVKARLPAGTVCN